jgi:hypothetical protein
MKLVRSLTALGQAAAEGGGEKFVISINLGADTKLKFEKDVSPVIEQKPDGV